MDIQYSVAYSFIKLGDSTVSYTEANHALDSVVTELGILTNLYISTATVQFNKAEYIGQWDISFKAAHLTDTAWTFTVMQSQITQVTVIDSICNTDTTLNL
jgi:hypothetical protein